MGYSYQIDTNANVMRVVLDDAANLDDRESALQQIVNYLLEYPTMGILLDVRQVSKSRTENQSIDYGRLLGSKSERFSKSKLSILRDNTDTQLIETSIAYLDGFENVVEFDNESDAYNWVTGQIQ